MRTPDEPSKGEVRVLVVEDSPTQAALTRFTLEDHGFSVEVARNGREALARLGPLRPSLVVTDVMMPEMDGFELCRILKSNKETVGIPVLLLTSLSDPRDVIRALECGADQFVGKPFDEGVLIGRIRSLVGATSSVPGDAVESGAPVEIDFSGQSHVIASSNSKVLRMLLSTFEDAVQKNRELLETQTRLVELNASLEERVRERTESLSQEIERRKTVEAERARIFEREQHTLEELREASRLKDEFLAMVSHELRTPLTPLLGWVRMLRSGALGASKYQEVFDVLERNLQMQAHIVNDLLDFSRLVSGKMQLDVSPVDLGGLVGKVAASISPMARAKTLSLDVKVASPGPIVQGDADRIQQVVWNLLSNAVKFSERGGTVEVTVDSAANGGRLLVRDHGIGISGEFLPHVFERFRQESSGTTRSFGGLGLGLSIAQQLAEVQGGSLTAESDGVGRGAAFTLLLPLQGNTGPTHRASGDAPPAGSTPGLIADGGSPPQEARTSGTERAAREDPLAGNSREPWAAERQGFGQGADPSQTPSLTDTKPLLGLRVLVVEDDDDTRDLIAMLLELAGAEVKAAHCAQEALNTLGMIPPDIIVSDLSMPNEDGFTLIEKVRQGSGSGIPAIALTAHTRQEERSRALDAGFQVHMPKPPELNKLVSSVARLTGRTELIH